jgi:hypothetical protein
MRSTLVVSLLAVLISCSNSGQPTSPQNELELSSSDNGDTSGLGGTEYVDAGILTSEQLLDIHKLTRGLALSLNDPSTRIAIRDKMRESPFNEHKIIFQNIFANLNLSPGISSASGLTERHLEDVLSTLPELDLYLPWSEHRQTWKASDDILVGIVFNVNNPRFTAYDLTGNAVTIDARENIFRPIMVLHPAERKLRRTNSELTTGPSDVIERPGDSFPQSRTLETSEMCSDPEYCGGSGYQIDFLLLEFEQYYEGDAVGQGELEFNFRYRENGQVTRENTLYYGSGFNCCSPHVEYFPTDAFWSGPTPLDFNHYVEMDIREEDPGLPFGNGDEEWIDDQTISSSGQLDVDLELWGSCNYFYDDDHGYIDGHSGGSCHHELIGTATTPIIEVRVDQRVRN